MATPAGQPTERVTITAADLSVADNIKGPQRTLTLARYAILVESAVHPPLRAQLAAGGSRVRVWFTNWLRIVGSTDPERDAPSS